METINSRIGKKGQTSVGVIANITLLIVGAAFVYIGLYLNAELRSTINDTMDQNVSDKSNQEETFNSVASNLDTAFTLMGVVFIVIGATVVIGVLRTAF